MHRQFTWETTEKVDQKKTLQWLSRTDLKVGQTIWSTTSIRPVKAPGVDCLEKRWKCATYKGMWKIGSKRIQKTTQQCCKEN